jgi:mannose-1-phosphate guanylyltransferase / mannose-6-phosphate isomerase
MSFISSGNYYWNAGIFMMTAQVLRDALAQYAPDILQAAEKAVALQLEDGDFIRLDSQAFAECRAQSFDYAVMERHDNIAVVPFHGGWSDVGSWSAVSELTQAVDSENRINGQGRAHSATNTYIHAPHRPVVALGTQDLVIIDTQDAVLVADKRHTENVKDIVEQLKQEGLPQATEHRYAARPWGQYDTVDQGQGFKVKRITVNPGASLSLQRHAHRAEHWVVVRGTARVTRGTEVFELSANQSAFIPAGEKHRLENPGSTPLEIIEVQTGNYLEEDDIERFEDVYGR